MYYYRYSEWSETQVPPSLGPNELMRELSEYLLSQGDLNSAMKMMVQRGFKNKELIGVQEMLEKLRLKRQRLLEKYDLSGLLDEVRKGLVDVVDMERNTIERRLREPRDSIEGEHEGRFSTEEATDLMHDMESMAEERKEYPDSLPSDLGKRLKSLGEYEFLDQGAREKYEELLEMVKGQVGSSIFEFKSDAAAGTDGLAEMVRRMNRMLYERSKGGDPDFNGFREEFKEIFGEDGPRSLDDLLEGIGERMQNMRSLLESLSPQQKGSLGDIVGQMLERMGMQDEVADMRMYLEALMGWDRPRRYPFRGGKRLNLTEALDVLAELGDIEALEKHLKSAQYGDGLRDVDREKVKELLGEEEADSVGELMDIGKTLEDSGYVRKVGAGYELTPLGMRKIGQQALGDIFERIKKDKYGGHNTKRHGLGLEVAEDSKTYEYGDAFLLDLKKTVLNAVGRAGPGIPVRLIPSDFEVHRTTQTSQCSTVLMLDVSLSMARRGSFHAAKKVALALHNLISTQFPRDNLYIIGFSRYAKEVKGKSLPYLEVNEFGYGTNMQQGFIVSQRLLSRHSGGTKQIILISDGEPTAHVEQGNVYFGYPPSPRTIQETLNEVRHCTRQGITINTFMLDRNYYLKEFVSQMTRINRGKAFYTSPDKLGQYILMDYLTARSKRLA
ncbi:MAG: VWA domain-containing protein [Dehalococcoidia bacterium]|nr:VWA domain-containing protein [Dehalococcoidia bacterium]